MTKYYDIKYDKEVQKLQYVPYLNGINEEYITLFNKNILKRRFGYYKDEKNEKNYNSKYNRYLNDDDRYKSYQNEYNDIKLLYTRLTSEFDNIIEKLKKELDNYNNLLKNTNTNKYVKLIEETTNNIINYQGYKQKIQHHLYYQIKRLENIIYKIKHMKDGNSIVEYKYMKKLNIFTLILVIFLILIIFLIGYIIK